MFYKVLLVLAFFMVVVFALARGFQHMPV